MNILQAQDEMRDLVSSLPDPEPEDEEDQREEPEPSVE